MIRLFASLAHYTWVTRRGDGVLLKRRKDVNSEKLSKLYHVNCRVTCILSIKSIRIDIKPATGIRLFC